MTPDTMSKSEISCLVFLETCAIDAGGLVEGRRMNSDDHAAAARFRAEGLAELYRIPARLLGGCPGNRNYTHWVRLTDAGFALAHHLRKARSGHLGPYAKEVFAELAEMGKLPTTA